MTKAQLEDFYKKRRDDFDASLAIARRKINNVSNLRLVLAAGFLALLYFGFTNNDLLYGLFPVAIVFAILVQQHGQLFRKKTHLENLVSINEAELQALSGNYSGLNAGLTFIDYHHPYSHDLDIFGDGSLFQYINRSSTFSGMKALASQLIHQNLKPGEIIAYQQAHRELASDTDFRQHFQAAGKEIEELPSDREQLKEWIKHPSFLYPKKSYTYFLAIFPVVTVFALIGSFFYGPLGTLAIGCAAFQWAFLGLHLKRVNAFHQYISRKKNVLQKFAHMLHYMQQGNFKSPILESLTAQAKDAGTRVHSLASLVRALDARLNSMTNLVVNSLLLYDLQCIYRLERWKETHSENLISWLDAISRTESLCSFGTFGFNHAHFAYPQINSDLTIDAKDMGHPLIAPEECVPNDLEMSKEKSILIITGANMAGKSTFLRTLGANIVLALAGSPVCATRFNCPVISLRSGMRTADSLKDHQSYFYAELNRLKSIMDELRSDKPLLILLDEILKGTNSTDKQAGSIALVKQLMGHPCLALIATHDIILGELENQYPGQIRNFCFEANIENDQLSFDYKLKKGVASKMNATFLMTKMGIIPR